MSMLVAWIVLFGLSFLGEKVVSLNQGLLFTCLLLSITTGCFLGIVKTFKQRFNLSTWTFGKMVIIWIPFSIGVVAFILWISPLLLGVDGFLAIQLISLIVALMIDLCCLIPTE